MTRAVAILVSLLVPAAAAAAPCTTATTECAEWIPLRGGPARSLVYRTYPLDGRNEKLTRALVMVHGTGRDAHNYFRAALAAAFLAGALDDTVVVAPRFASSDGGGCRDMLAPNEVSWPCNGNSWRSGGIAGDGLLTSFELVDEILRRLARKDLFPNLTTVVVAGHSAGAQFTTRYEMANRVHDTLGIDVSYVVANPSSYAYLDESRPVAARNCATYDKWPYGLRDRTGYAAAIPDAQLKKQLAGRKTTYLMGQLDVLPNAGFDGSCAAMAQGPTRLARGQAFGAYVNQRFGAHHTVTVVPLCGHNARCMFTADVALPVLFPRAP